MVKLSTTTVYEGSAGPMEPYGARDDDGGDWFKPSEDVTTLVGKEDHDPVPKEMENDALSADTTLADELGVYG